MTKKILLASFVLLLVLTGCRLFVKPEPQTYMIERVQGSYVFNDAENSYSGQFVLKSHEDKLGMEIYGPFHLYVGSIRHNPDSTLLYLPLDATLFVMGPGARIPFEGWEIPLEPLVSIYRGDLPAEPDSTTYEGDTLLIWLEGIAYLASIEGTHLLELRGEGWCLSREGNLTEDPVRPAEVAFSTQDSELILTFLRFELIEKKREEAFGLNFPEDVQKVDLRQP